MKLTKYEGNPILSANPNNAWEALCVLNPACVFDEADSKFKLLYRAAGNDVEHYIYVGLAESTDGFNFTRTFDRPVLSPDIGGADGGGIEDPRVVKMDDWYYMTYASRTYPPGQYWKSLAENKLQPPEVPSNGPSFTQNNCTVTHLAASKNLRDWKKLGRITDSRADDRDVLIFPDRVNGRFVRLSRPVKMSHGLAWSGGEFTCKNPSIWIAYSDDLLEWDKPQLLMEGREWWEDKKIGASCPPIKTEKGWFHLYHGVSTRDNGYRVGAVLLDLNDPAKIIARTGDFLMEPEYGYETQGYYNGCVFPTGNVVHGGRLYVYYGGADKYVCAAYADFDRLISYLLNECRA